MKQYLIDTFRFNELANKLTLPAMQKMPDESEGVNSLRDLLLQLDYHSIIS